MIHIESKNLSYYLPLSLVNKKYYQTRYRERAKLLINAYLPQEQDKTLSFARKIKIIKIAKTLARELQSDLLILRNRE
jgi:hypothetical protein